MPSSTIDTTRFVAVARSGRANKTSTRSQRLASALIFERARAIRSGSDSDANEDDDEVEEATEDDDDKDEEVEEATDEDDDTEDDDDDDIAGLSEPDSTFSLRQCRVSNPSIETRCNCRARQHIASIGHCSCGVKPPPLTPPSS